MNRPGIWNVTSLLTRLNEPSGDKELLLSQTHPGFFQRFLGLIMRWKPLVRTRSATGIGQHHADGVGKANDLIVLLSEEDFNCHPAGPLTQ